jgi:pyridoxal phosphate enzyme (YggS family)
MSAQPPAGGPDLAGIGQRVAEVRRRIAAAARRAGRDPADVTLVAVAKLHPPEAVRAAVAAGVADIGENYAQELAATAAAVPGARWHFVGRIQRNKAPVLVATGALVHTLDSLPAARALGRRALAAGTVSRALVQVELEERAAAHGVPAAGLEEFTTACRQVEGLRLEGLMLMPPPAASPEDQRPLFRRLAELAKRLGAGMRALSMGMTDDFEVAVEEGATLVRIGTAIFGPRPTKKAAKGGAG